MKKLMVYAILVVVTASCSNPEDNATGNPDSTSFNSDEQKVTNSLPGATDPNSASAVENPDSSSAAASLKKNAKDPTNGTNRAYGTEDTAKMKKQ